MTEKTIIVFLAYTAHSWGKGKTLSEALKNLRTHYGSKPKEFGLAIYQAESFDEIYMTEFSEIHRGENDRRIYSEMEKI